jgi:hypothetical protein
MGRLPWWIPGKVVLSLEVAGLPANRVPREHARSEIDTSGKMAGKKEVYLYNPRTKAAAGKVC